jgi:AcrR family transcriptional regulator
VGLEATKPKREEIVRSIAAHLMREGFANSGIRALASRAGMSDRMLMYYFETKDELITEALEFLTQSMAVTLGELLPERQTPAADIVKAAVLAAQGAELQASLRLWFEIVGLAVRGAEPYATTVNRILEDWEEWIRCRPRPDQQHRAPELLAQIEGRLMLELPGR